MALPASTEPVELSARQRFELAYLCAEWEARADDPGAKRAIVCLLCAYVLAEGITPEHFRPCDSPTLDGALLAATHAPAEVAAGTFGPVHPDATGSGVVREAERFFERLKCGARGG